MLQILQTNPCYTAVAAEKKTLLKIGKTRTHCTNLQFDEKFSGRKREPKNVQLRMEMVSENFQFSFVFMFLFCVKKTFPEETLFDGFSWRSGTFLFQFFNWILCANLSHHATAFEYNFPNEIELFNTKRTRMEQKNNKQKRSRQHWSVLQNLYGSFFYRFTLRDGSMFNVLIERAAVDSWFERGSFALPNRSRNDAIK